MLKLRHLAIFVTILGLLIPLLSACGERQDPAAREPSGDQNNERSDQDRNRKNDSEKHDD